MNRKQKQLAIAVAAQELAEDLHLGSDAFFGNQGVTVYVSGETGDIVGYVLAQAGVLPNVSFAETDPKAAVALALGVTLADLSEGLQESINVLATTADDTKRSYARRVPKLVSLLENFAEKIENESITRSNQTSTKTPAPKRFEIPGKSL